MDANELVKRRLGPLLPVLRPIKRRALAVLYAAPLRTLVTAPDRAAHAVRRGILAAMGRVEPPIRGIHRFEFEAVARSNPYYRPRWRYISVAGAIADDLIRRHGLTTALELGPYLRPVIVGADAMDRRVQEDLESEGDVIIHDATELPWPFANKQYDLFVALQVFEHLGNQQEAAFREVRRIARHAEISLPIDWVMADPRNCHHQISHEQALSWFAPVRPTRVVTGNGGSRKRLIYVFEDLDA